jgi:hypothetical protein
MVAPLATRQHRNRVRGTKRRCRDRHRCAFGGARALQLADAQRVDPKRLRTGGGYRQTEARSEPVGPCGSSLRIRCCGGD